MSVSNIKDLKIAFYASYSQGVLLMFIVSTFFVYTPVLLDKLYISETQFAFGITLFGIFNIVTNQLVTRFIIPRIGTTNCLIIARLTYAFIPFFIYISSTYYFFILFQSLWGIAMGFQAPSVFTQVAIIESKTNKILNPIFKSSFSVGSIIGAFIASVCFGNEVDPKLLFFLIGVFVFVSTLTMYIYGLSKKYDYVDKSPKFSLPSITVFLFAFVNTMFFASIGIILNWSSLWFITDLSGPLFLAGFIILFFNLGEISSNLIGSFMIKKFSEKIVGPFFGMTGAIILFLSVLSQNIYFVFFGIIMFGFLTSNMGPIVIRQSILHSKVSVPATISHVSSIGFSGLIFGPAIVGYSAQQYGLTFNMYSLCITFFLISILMLTVMNKTKEK